MSWVSSMFGARAPDVQFAAGLSDAARYLEQIDRLHFKHRMRRRLLDVEQEGVTLAAFCMDRGKVARILAETVGAGRYDLQPARVKLVTIHGKPWRTSHITFLGCCLAFDGTVSLKPNKVRQLLNDVRGRVRRTLLALSETDPEVAGRVVCGIVNEALNPGSISHQKSALLLRALVTSRPLMANGAERFAFRG